MLHDLDEIERLYPVLPKCPFCNGYSSPNSHMGKCWVECDVCGARGPKFVMEFNDTKPAYVRAIMAWASRNGNIVL